MIKVSQEAPTEPGKYLYREGKNESWKEVDIYLSHEDNGDLMCEGNKIEGIAGYWRCLIWIFIPNKAGHDFKPAERYGTLVYISKGFQDKHATNTMQRQWEVALKDSQPDDIIMMAGLSNMQAIGCGMFALMHGRLNILIFDPETKYKYTLRQNVFEEGEDESPTS